MAQQTQVFFHYNTHNFSLKDRNHLKRFISLLFKKEKRALDTINYIFCTDEYLLELNKHYLKHFTLTDIITFELNAPKEPVVSDVFISIDRVKENAETFQLTFKQELHRVIFHGALHLCGYKDKTKTDQLIMRQKEDYYLNKYFVSRGTL